MASDKVRGQKQRNKAQRLEDDHAELMKLWQPPAGIPVRQDPPPRPFEPRIVESVVTYGAYEDPI